MILVHELVDEKFVVALIGLVLADFVEKLKALI